MVDLAELKTELDTDPTGLGYTGSDGGDAELLNEPRASIQLNRATIPMGEIYGQIDWDDEYLALGDAQKTVFRTITSTVSLDVRSQHIRDAFVAIFGGGSATIANLQAILTRDGSRAEELWGHGETVTPSQVADARRL